jgi:hypothetical protein
MVKMNLKFPPTTPAVLGNALDQVMVVLLCGIEIRVHQ